MSRGVIITTGIGRSEKVNQPEKLAERLGLPYRIFDWQQYIEPESDELMIRHTQYGSMVAKKARKAIYDYLYDETGYTMKRDEIMDGLETLIRTSGFTEIVLVGHSWGAVIMYDFMEHGDTHGQVKTLITTGCPLPFRFGGDIQCPVYVEWYNYWEKNDAIAHKILKPFCVDIEFKSSNWFKGWNVAAHASYFKSRKLAKMIREIL